MCWYLVILDVLLAASKSICQLLAWKQRDHLIAAGSEEAPAHGVSCLVKAVQFKAHQSSEMGI